jgi:hypothetical protein
MCKLVGGDKVLLLLNGEHALFFTYLLIKGNSPFSECEFYSQLVVDPRYAQNM